MSIRAVDLFAGGGGTTTGAKQAGVEVVWAANHNPVAVECHAKNHPEVTHACQDLHQADWSTLPAFDLLCASPECQGHSRAAGNKLRSKKADVSRSTAWAVISCLDTLRPPLAIIENVEDFRRWELFASWQHAMQAMGYALSFNLINARDVGIPQNRLRLFLVATQSKNPITIQLQKEAEVPARTIIDLNMEGYKWDLVSNRVKATRDRVANGRKQYGEIFLDAAYGSAVSGRSIDTVLGTVMTTNKHSLVIGDHIRSLTIPELAAAQSFSPDVIWPSSSVATKALIGNAVPPTMAEKVIRAVLKAA